MHRQIAPGEAPYTATVSTWGGRITIDHGLPMPTTRASYTTNETRRLIEALNEALREIEGTEGPSIELRDEIYITINVNP